MSDVQVAKRSRKNQVAAAAPTKQHATRSQTKHALAQQQQQQQQLEAQRVQQVEEWEAKASAEAKAGLNLNIFGAISGVFGGRSRKTTDTAADGSSHSVEEKEGIGAFKGRGAGTMTAVAEGKADVSERRTKMVEAEVKQERKKGKKAVKEAQQVDHLGLGEDWGQ
jgi:hypothetical protein